MNISNFPFIMIKCLLYTIIIELIIAFVLQVKDKKDIKTIVLVNILTNPTNPIVVLVPTLVYIKYGYIYRNIVLYLLEIITVLTEGLIYYKLFKYKKLNPFIFSLLLNLSSYLIGEIINML